VLLHNMLQQLLNDQSVCHSLLQHQHQICARATAVLPAAGSSAVRCWHTAHNPVRC
jgi:hypothetical protein